MPGLRQRVEATRRLTLRQRRASAGSARARWTECFQTPVIAIERYRGEDAHAARNSGRIAVPGVDRKES